MYNQEEGIVMGKPRKKINKREMRERGFIAEKSKQQVKEILKSLKINENERLEKWKLKNPK